MEDYCIIGIFPGTFISRKMLILTFSGFSFSRPTHGCIDLKFSDNATKRSGCRTCQCRRSFLCARETSHLYKYVYRFVAGEYCKHVSPVMWGLMLKDNVFIFTVSNPLDKFGKIKSTLTLPVIQYLLGYFIGRKTYNSLYDRYFDYIELLYVYKIH